MEQYFSSKSKNLRIVLIALTLLTVRTPAVLADITGSAHDFSTQGWSGGKICVACHTPHNADQTVDDSPLWNHEVTSADYILYNSNTMDSIPEQPGGVSKLCLSCHDGTVAVDAFGGNTGSHFITGNPNIGTDLSNDHPIGIEWTHQTVTGDCAACHQAIPGGGITFGEPLVFFDGKVECATCHNVHNNGPEIKMLRMTMTGSELCFYCHTDKN